MMHDKSPFWMVWNPQGRTPAFKHVSLAQATNEAERLARLNPSEVFYVLESIAMRTVDSMVRVDIRPPHYDPDQPF